MVANKLQMRFFLLLVGFSFFSVPVSAQNEFLNKNNSIAPTINGNKTTSSNSIYTPNVFNPKKTESTTSSSDIPDKQMEFKTNEFKNPNDSYVEKLNSREDQGDYKMFRKNQYLGDFRSNATSVKISCRDFGEVDGDEIKVLVNDKVVVSKIYLQGSYSTIELGLVKGFNKIDFEALNQGLLGPNTAQFRVTDETGQLISSNQWNLATGFKATIIIFKE